MPARLRRCQQSGQFHFITFSCYRCQPNFVNGAVYDLFPVCLEAMRRRFALRIYGYVLMPEHVHLLLSEPEQGTLAYAIHYLKLSFAKRLRSQKQKSAQVSVQTKDANLGHQTAYSWATPPAREEDSSNTLVLRFLAPWDAFKGGHRKRHSEVRLSLPNRIHHQSGRRRECETSSWPSDCAQGAV